MYQIIAWFQKNYPTLQQKMLMCAHSHETTSPNPYHIETDCWSHTMLVCKIAEIKAFHKVVCVASLLHDIGKPAARKINPKNNHVQFFGHEGLSAQIAQPILRKMVEEGIMTMGESDEVTVLIREHGVFYKIKGKEEIVERFKYKKRLYIHLAALNYCDMLGRFAADTHMADEHYEKHILYARYMQN